MSRSEREPANRSWFVLVMVVGTTILTGIGVSIMSVAFPVIRRAFPDASPSQLSWINNSFTIVSAATLIPAGVLADRIGRKKILLFGVAMFTAGSLIGALAPNPGWIMVGRVVQALGSSAYGPAGTALLISVFPPERLAFAIGVWSVTSGASAALGPSAGGFVVDRGGWQWAFWINIPVGIVALIAGPLMLRETATDRSKRLPDPLGVLLVMACTSAFTFGVVQRKTSPGWGWLGYKTWAAFAVGAALLWWFIRRCQKHDNPLVQLDLFRISNVRVGVVGVLVISVSFFSLHWVIVQHMINQWGWSVFKAGAATAPISLISGISGIVSGRLSARHGHRGFILIGTVGIIASCLFFRLTLDADPALWGAIVPGGLLLGISSGLVFPSYISSALLGVPVDRHAVGSSINFMAQRIGMTFGIALAITFIAASAGSGALHRALVFTVSGCVVCFVLGLRITPTTAHV